MYFQLKGYELKRIDLDDFNDELTVDMIIIEGLSYIELMLILNSDVGCAGISVRMIGEGAGKCLGGAKDICSDLPKLARKLFVRLLPTNFLL